VVISLIFGALLAEIENWALEDGFFYIMSQITAMPNPLTNAFPTSNAGIGFLLVITMWAFSFMCVTVGFISAPLLVPLVRYLRMEVYNKREIARENITENEGSDNQVHRT